MARQSFSISDITTQLETTTKQLRTLSDMVESHSSKRDKTIESTLKDISNQLQSNEEQLKKLHQEVRCNRDEIEKCTKRMDALAYNIIARTMNRTIKWSLGELQPIRDCQNNEIKGLPFSAADFRRLTEDQCDRIAKEMDWPFYSWATLQDKQRSLLQAVGYGWDLDNL